MFFYLGSERLRRGYLAVGVVLGLFLFGLGWHLGWVEQGASVSSQNRHPFTLAFALATGIALFILNMLVSTWRAGDDPRVRYQRMLSCSWQQALTLGLLSLFVGAFWLLLFLWAGLFSAIGIRFFKELFGSIAFIYPVTWLVIGLGLILIQERIRFIATVQLMCEALIKALLPMAAGIVLLFLATLPFTGVQPVWNTGSAATLMMLLTLVLLFAFNAVLLNGEQNYRRSLRFVILIAVALLPVTSLLAGWALWLRVDQYGLTLDRLWAAIILFLISGFSFSYTAVLIIRRGNALAPLRTVNQWLAVLVIAVLMAINSPVADLRKWSANSQADRLLEGRIRATAFDYAYLRFSLGTYGMRALDRIESSDLARTEPEITRRVAAVRKQQYPWSTEPEVDVTDMAAVASMLDSAERLPDALLGLVTRLQKECMTSDAQCMAIQPTHAAGHPQEVDWLVFRTGRYVSGAAYRFIEGQWMQIGTLSSSCNAGAEVERPQQLERLDGPFLAYRHDDCFYTVTPTTTYLRRLATP